MFAAQEVSSEASVPRRHVPEAVSHLPNTWRWQVSKAGLPHVERAKHRTTLPRHCLGITICLTVRTTQLTNWP